MPFTAKRDIGNNISRGDTSAYSMHVCACRTHLVVLHDGSGLSLGGHIQFSGVPSLPPFAEREISASPVFIRLPASVLLSPPVSLSFALPSVFPSYWRAISVHPKAQRRSRGTQKRGGAARGFNDDRREHAVTSALFLFLPFLPFPLHFLFCLLSSLPPDDFLRHTERARRE